MRFVAAIDAWGICAALLLLGRLISDFSLALSLSLFCVRSPEQVMETSYNAKSDIWSLGKIGGRQERSERKHSRRKLERVRCESLHLSLCSSASLRVPGCLIYELAALAPPFRAQNHLALATKIRAGVFERIPARYSEELQRLIRSMIQVEQQRRPTIEAILRHPRIAARIQAEKEREEAKKKAAIAQQQAASAAANAAANAATAASAAAAATSPSSTPCASCAANSASLAHAQRNLRDEAAALQRRAEDLARREAAVLDRERKAREREMNLDKRDMQAMKMGAAGTGMMYRTPLAQLNVNGTVQPSYANLER